ncbi:MAG: hypothetical protein AVDCRST_MAG64-1643, partial [uncultured Phycisphaerae bacterium]
MSDTRTVKSPASAEPLERRTFLSVSTLVPGFGEGGRVVADLGGQDGAVDLAAEPSGKLIVLANRSTADGAGYVLARFNADGSPDAAFGDAGRVVSGFADFRIARALALAPDGRILVGGNTADPGIPNADGTTTAGPGSSDFAVARYNADGSLDATFGDGGKALADLNGNSFDDALDLVVADDGRVVAAGVAGPPAGTEVSALASSFAVARFDAGGRLDPTFGAGGRVLTDFAQQENVATSVALQPDGAVVVGGHAGEAGPATDNDAAFAVARYAPDGTPDPAFGDGGKVRVPLPDRPGHLAALAVTGDGKLLAAGTALDPNPRTAPPGVFVIGPDLPDSAVALTRLNADGSVDASLGAAGVVVEDFGGSASVDDALLGDDGTLYVAGGLRFNAGDVSLNEVLLARFTAQGAVDATFATNGRVATGFTPENEYDHDRATAVAAGRDGTTVVAGAAAGDTAL